MKSNLALSTLLLLSVILGSFSAVSCGGGSGTELIVGDISGVSSVNEETTGWYSITASGDTGITYLWAVEPASAGTIMDGTTADARFWAGPVASDTLVTIKVTVNSDLGVAHVAEKDITIKKTGGDLDWARTWGAAYDEAGYDVAVDGSGNAYVAGGFTGTADLDPGSGVDNHTSNGASDIFLSKFDSSGILLWAKTWGGSAYDAGPSVAVDGSGNAFVTGVFSGTVDFDPGSGVDEHTLFGDTHFLSKLDSSGNFLWAKTWGGGGLTNDRAESNNVAVDSTGNPHVTGLFQGDMDLDPGSGVDNHLAYGGWNSFLSKFDTSGSYLWGKHWGGDGSDTEPSVPCGLAVDNSGNAYVTGWFKALIDFDPGTGIVNHTPDGVRDAFLSKLDSSGNFVWAKTWGKGDSLSMLIANGVAADSSGNVYVTGEFSGTVVDFNPADGAAVDNHTSNGQEVFLSKFDSSGNFSWAKTWAGASAAGQDATTDSAGNVYVTGNFGANPGSLLIDFDPGTGVDNHGWGGSGTDVFVSEFDSSGNFIWAKTWGGSNSDEGSGIAVDSTDNIFVTGMYSSSVVDFNPGSGVDDHVNNGQFDAFLSKLLPDGS